MPHQQTQAERDRTVVRLRITPADVVARIGERLQFAATAEDGEGRPVGGVAFTWRTERGKARSDLAISDDGLLTTDACGTYRVVAEGAGRRAEATVRVVPEDGLGSAAPASLTSGTSAQVIPAAAPASGGHASLLPPQEPSWEDERWRSAAEDPVNRRGANPLANQTPAGSAQRGGFVDNSGAGSGNARFTLPLVNLPGRGINLALALTYNSLLWQQIDSGPYSMVFAPKLDDDWPAPGWTLGFGKVVGRVLIDANGDRHVLDGSGYTTDGSRIDCTYNQGTRPHCRYADGSVIEFDHYTIFGVNYPTRIVDADGNYVTIRYRPLSVTPGRPDGPSIETITDTLGRTITFHYQRIAGFADDNDTLTAITGPGLNGGVRTLAQFMWGIQLMEPTFGGGRKTWPTRLTDIRVLKAVYYPDTAAGYWFGDADSYSSYGMIASVQEQRAMTVDRAAPTTEASIQPGRTIHKVTYNYPLAPQPNLTKAPAYTKATEVWEGMSTAPAVTEYHVTTHRTDPTVDWPRILTITYPDGSREIQKESDGKPYRVETRSSDNRFLSMQAMSWEDGEPYRNRGSKPPRLKSVVTTYADVGSAKVEYAYDSFNQLTDLREYDFEQTTVRRRTHTEYENAPEYRARHVFGLVNLVETYNGETGDPATRTQIKYDAQAMSPTPGIVQYDRAFDPHASPVWVPPTCETACTSPCKPPRDREQPDHGGECEPECREVCHGAGHWKPAYDPETAFRGHVREVTRFGRAADRSEPVKQRFRYDLAGNLVSIRSGPESSGISYTSATQYAYPEQSILGAEDTSSPNHVVLHSSYDFNTGIQLSSTDADGLTTLLESSPKTLLPTRLQYPGGASTTFDYDAKRLMVTTTTRPAPVHTCCPPSVVPATEVQMSTTWLDGRGMPTRQAQLAPVGADTSWDVSEWRYDQLGRPAYVSNPARRSGEPSTWAAPEHWHVVGYDDAGRVTSIQGPDGSTSLMRYNEVQRPHGASDKPGATTLTLDPWGRWRWSRRDVLGQLVEVVEAAPDGDGSLDGAGNLVTTYDYDPVGLVGRITQGGQERLFDHDSLGRLRRQALPEMDRTLNAAGSLVGASGTWSDVFNYDDRSDLTSVVDARGVRTNYHYGDDPLGRLQQVSYTLPTGSGAGQITSVGPSHFAYEATGDITRIKSVTTDQVGVENYEYAPDSGLVSSSTLELADWPGHPLAVDTAYDSLGRLVDLWYPAQYGVRLPRDEDRRQVHQTSDSVGRPETTSMTRFPQRDVSDVSSVLRYGVAGQVESMRTGPAGPKELIETYPVDLVNLQTSGQQVTRGTERLLDLSYDFRHDISDKPSRTEQLTAMTDNLHPDRSLHYSYDQVGRLSSATQGTAAGPAWTQTYDYDRYGNRTAVHATAPPGHAAPIDGRAATPVDEGSNRLRIVGYSYDAAGNLTRSKEGGVWLRYRYDAVGRLAAVLTDGGAELESYIYGYAGNRVVTRHATGPVDRTIYAWAGGQVLSEYSRARVPPGHPQDVPRWSRDNIYQQGQLAAGVEASQNGAGPDVVRYFHSDRVGSRLITGPGVTDKTEQVTLPFGAAADSSTGFNPRFTSYDRSPTTGLDYAINRFYSPSHGRFTQPDPIGNTWSGDPQTLNLYAYGANDPVNTVDPSGLDAWCEPSAGGFVEDANGVHFSDPVSCFNDETKLKDWLNQNPDPAPFESSPVDWIPTPGGYGMIPAPTLPAGPSLSASPEAWTYVSPPSHISGPIEALENFLRKYLHASDTDIESLGLFMIANPVGEIGALAAELEVAEAGSRGLSSLGGVVSEAGTNAVGGRVFTSTGRISQNDFAGIVNNGLMRGDDVHILTGVHGLPSGGWIPDATMYANDVARFGQLPGVSVHDVTSMSESAISNVLQRPGTIIGGFCDSAVCLAPYR
jgi:RHS repeat-associated protein